MFDRLFRDSPRRNRIDQGVASFSRGAFMAAIAASMGAFSREAFYDGQILAAFWTALSLLASGVIAILLLVNGLVAIAHAATTTADRRRNEFGPRSVFAATFSLVCLVPLLYFLLAISFQGADRAIDFLEADRPKAAEQGAE